MTQAQREIATGRILAIGDFPGGSPDPETIEIVDLDPTHADKLGEAGEKVLDKDGAVTVLPLPPPTADEIAEDARQTKLSGARPANAILVKLRDGADLTPAEMQRVVRYLGLREFREARG